MLVPALDNPGTLLTVGKLAPGSSFGELALLSNKPRAATIESLTDIVLGVLYKKDYKRILKQL